MLIPVFNRQRPLMSTVESLRDQGTAFDIVIVDDGSAVPVEPPPHPGEGEVFLIRSGRNTGIVGALNLGLAFIFEKGYEYVARLDAGDRAGPQRLSRQESYMDAHPNCAVVGGQVRYRLPSGEAFNAMPLPTGSEELRRSLHLRTCFFHPAVMMRATPVREAGGYPRSFPYAEDYALFMMLGQRHDLANVAEVVLFYEYTPTSISQAHRRRQALSILLILARHFDPRLWESYAGLVIKSASLLLPYKIMGALKRKLITKHGVAKA